MEQKKEANPKQSWITFDTQLLCHLEASFTVLDMICPLFLSWEATRARACVLAPQCQSLVQYVALLPFGHFATFWDNLSLFDSHFLFQRMFDSHFLDSMSVNVTPSQQVLSFSSIKLSNNEVNMDGELTKICALVLMTFDIAYKYRIKWSCLPFYSHRCRR